MIVSAEHLNLDTLHLAHRISVYVWSQKASDDLILIAHLVDLKIVMTVSADNSQHSVDQSDARSGIYGSDCHSKRRRCRKSPGICCCHRDNRRSRQRRAEADGQIAAAYDNSSQRRIRTRCRIAQRDIINIAEHGEKADGLAGCSLQNGNVVQCP